MKQNTRNSNEQQRTATNSNEQQRTATNSNEQQHLTGSKEKRIGVANNVSDSYDALRLSPAFLKDIK